MGRGGSSIAATSFTQVLGKRRYGSAAPPDRPTIAHGLVITSSWDVTVDGHPIALSVAQRRLFQALATDPRRCLSFAELNRAIYNDQDDGERRITSLASMLRSQLCTYNSHQWVIRRQGVGYQLLP